MAKVAVCPTAESLEGGPDSQTMHFMTTSLLKHDQGSKMPFHYVHPIRVLFYTPFRVLVYLPFVCQSISHLCASLYPICVLVYIPFVFYVLHLPSCHILTFLTVRPRSFPVPQLGSHSDLAN